MRRRRILLALVRVLILLLRLRATLISKDRGEVANIGATVALERGRLVVESTLRRLLLRLCLLLLLWPLLLLLWAIGRLLLLLHLRSVVLLPVDIVSPGAGALLPLLLLIATLPLLALCTPATILDPIAHVLCRRIH